MQETVFETKQIAAFTKSYKPLFKDKRLYDTFGGTLCGILNSGSLCINRIASRSPLGCNTRHAERRIRRLVHGENQRAPLPYDALLQRFSLQGAKHVQGDHELVLILDVCYLRKPFATRIEHLDTVRDLEGKAVPGFYTLNVFAIAASGKRALIYHKTFSTHEPGFKSLTDEYLKAIDQSTDVLRQQGVGRIIWLLDRGFDDLKLMRHIHQQNNLFVLRAQHHKRQVLTRLDGRPQPIRAALHKTPVLTSLTLERLLFDPHSGKRRSVEVTVQAASFELVEARGLRLTGVMVGSSSLAEGWLLLSNLPLAEEAELRVAVATRMVLLYRQRWAIEDLFKWTKAVLDWETVRVLDYEALRVLVAFAWLAAAFLFELGVTLDDEQLLFLAQLGGHQGGKRKPGKQTLARGLQQLLTYFFMEQRMKDPQQRQQMLELARLLFLDYSSD